MSKKIYLEETIPQEYAGQRLDRALALLFSDYSRSCLQQWILQEHVRVNGKIPQGKDPVQGGETVVINAELQQQVSHLPENISLNIIYEDEAFIIVNKPIGLVVHPAAGNHDGTLLNALLHHHPALAELPRGGIVHRIDKDTSGLLVIAKTLSAHHHLVQQLQDRELGRLYETIVHGIVTSGGTIDMPIGRDPKHRTKMAVISSGKPAITHYRLIKQFAAHTHLAVQLETGRTHQIRVHLAHNHHPIIGDQTYGGRMRVPKNCSESLRMQIQQFKRQALHARELHLIHPLTQKPMSFSAELPEDMAELLRGLSGRVN